MKIKFPREEEPRDGWIISFKFLRKIEQEIEEHNEGFCLTAEDVEAMLLTIEEMDFGINPLGFLVDESWTSNKT